MTFRFAYRVRRQKAAAAAAILLALVVIASSAVSARSRATIGDAIEHNGRGAYDLLITAAPGGHRTPTSTGLVEQNFTSLSGSSRIRADQLAAIRDIPGVDVAAPLAFMGELTSPAYGLLVGARDRTGSTESFFTADPKLFDVSVELDTSNGVQTQTLSSTQTTMALARVGAGASAGVLLAAPNVDSANTFGMSADITIPGVPQLSSGIVAVDPAAEQRLLGRGRFLQPLTEFDQAVRDGAKGAGLTSLVPDRYDLERNALAGAPSGTLALPLVVSDSAYAPLRAKVTVTPVDTHGMDAATLFASAAPGVTTLSAAGQQLVDQGERGAPQTTTVDLTHRVVPFAQPYFSIPLPGAAAGPDGAADVTSPGLASSAVTAVQYQPAPAEARADAPANTAAARMEAKPQGFQSLSPSAREQTYRPLPAGGSPQPGKSFLFAPLGTYTPGDVTGTAGQVSYVPLGTYAAGTATVTQAGDHQGAKLGPSFSGRGLELAAPGAITSLDALRAVQPGAGVDVVRVRVAGPRTYDASAVKKIEAVASRIADLGLQVRVVAGSSLTPVGVYVPDFFAQPVSGSSDLGWTEQEWTSLGAAVTVQRANIGAAAWLFAVSLLAVTVLAGAVQVIALDGRRRETALLLELGWRRRRIFCWFLAEGTAGLAIVAVGAVIALVFNAGNPLALTASVCAVAASLLLTTGGAWLSSHSSRRISSAAAKAARPARSPRAVGGQVSRSRPLAAATTSLALVVLALTASAFTAVLTRAHTTAGNSRISELVTSRVLLPHLLLALLGCLAGGALFALGTGQLRAAVRPQLSMLVSGGWTGRDLAVLARAAVSRPARPALLIGTLGGLALSLLTDPQHWWLATLPAPAVMLLTVAAAQTTATLAAHQLTATTTPSGRAPRTAETSRRKAIR